MSQSPEAPTETAEGKYFDAWRRLQALVRDGGSWSGHERNCCFLNVRRGPFANVSSVSGLDFPDDARGLATVDWDHDGDLDLWVTNRNAPRVRFLRNENANGNHFLAVRLQGNGATTNRDAIGARVEVHLAGGTRRSPEGSPPLTLAKTLRAGEGFLSQSSKWLRFGLGDAPGIERVVVRWPGGKAESFSDFEVDHHYRVVQGSGTARRWVPPPQNGQLRPSQPVMPQTTEHAAICLAARLPMPSIGFEAIDGDHVSLREHLGTPVLVNLWASWCRPCILELRELAAEHQRLQRAGLKIVALSVDRLQDGQSSARPPVAGLLDQLKLPFQVGFADATLLEKLQIVNNHLFYENRPLPVPLSLLIDGRGQLAAVYKGPVHVERLLADLHKLPLKDSGLRQAALPFSGRELLFPGPHKLVPFAAQLLAKDCLQDVQQLISENGARMNHEALFPELLTQLGQQLAERGEFDAARAQLDRAIRLQPELAEAHYQRGYVHSESGRYELAVADYNKAIALDPKRVLAHNNRGTAQERLGRYEQAVRDYSRAIKLDPDYAMAYDNRGNIFHKFGRHEQAMADYGMAIELKPGFALAHNHRGTLYAQLGNLAAALEDYQQAIELQPDYARAHNNRGNIYAQMGRHELALADYDKAVELDADYAEAVYNRGQTSADLGNYREALKDYQRFIVLKPRDPDGHTTLAWLMATCPEGEYRDGPKAVASARRASELTQWKAFRVLNTLAAACAEAGDFSEAVRWQTEAMALAPEAAQAPLGQLLTLYKAEKPFHQPAVAPPAAVGHNEPLKGD